MRYWPVRIETAGEVAEVLIEAKHGRAETLRLLVEAYAGVPAVVFTLGSEPVEAPAGTRGQVRRLADVVARN